MAQPSGATGATHSLSGVHSFIQLRIIDHVPRARHWALVMLVADGLETHRELWLIFKKSESGLSGTVTAPELCRVLERMQALVFCASHSVPCLSWERPCQYTHLTGGEA